MKIGARTFKSGIAILISLIIPNLIGLPEATVLSGISSVATMQQSIKRSYDRLLKRIFSNVFGGFLAVLASYFFGTQYFVIAVTAIVLIALLHKFGLDDSISLACITLVVIMLNETDEIMISAITRVLGTIIGVTVSFLVNRIVLPPQYDEALYKKMVLQTNEIAKLLRSALRKNSQFGKVNDDLDALEANEIETLEMFSFIKEEAGFSLCNFDKNKTNEEFKAKSRILVVYRQFIRTNMEGLNLVQTFHKTEYLFNHFPKELRVSIRERLETLITAHEQIILKFNGRINASDVNFHEYKQDLRIQLTDSFFSLANSDEYMQDNQYDDSNAIIHLMSDIFKYEEQVQHLNVIVRSYRTKHKDTIAEIGEEVNLD